MSEADVLDLELASGTVSVEEHGYGPPRSWQRHGPSGLIQDPVASACESRRAASRPCLQHGRPCAHPPRRLGRDSAAAGERQLGPGNSAAQWPSLSGNTTVASLDGLRPEPGTCVSAAEHQDRLLAAVAPGGHEVT